MVEFVGCDCRNRSLGFSSMLVLIFFFIATVFCNQLSLWVNWFVCVSQRYLSKQIFPPEGFVFFIRVQGAGMYLYQSHDYYLSKFAFVCFIKCVYIFARQSYTEGRKQRGTDGEEYREGHEYLGSELTLQYGMWALQAITY